MVEQQDMTFTLIINSLTYPVTENTPVMIIWQRGKTKAQTKKKLMNDSNPVREFKEKFQINTKIAVDEDGKPSEKKMSKLVVASDKARGILGQVELDLADFVGDDYKNMKLNMEKEGCFIDVSVKGAPVDKTAPSKNQGLKDQIASIVDEIEQTKKQKEQLVGKNNTKLQEMEEKVKTLTKKLEDTKTQIAFKCKELGTFNDKKKQQEKAIQKLQEEADELDKKQKEVEEKILASNEGLKGIEEKKANAISQFATEKKTADDALASTQKEKEEISKVLGDFFQLSRFDTNYLAGKKTFPLASKKTSQVVLNQ